MIEFVFFDAGETLLHPYPSWSDRSVEVLRDRGHDVTVEELRAAWVAMTAEFEKAYRSGVRFSISTEASRTFWFGIYEQLLAHAEVSDPGAPEALYETFTDPSSYRLFDDVLPAIDALASAGIRIGIISNFEAWLEDLLVHLGVLDRFEVVAISGQIGVEKPDPAMFSWALDRAGVEPGRTIHVGDSRPFDPEAAIACGMRGVLLDRLSRHEGEDLPYQRVRSLDELPGVVRSFATA